MPGQYGPRDYAVAQAAVLRRSRSERLGFLPHLFKRSVRCFGRFRTLDDFGGFYRLLKAFDGFLEGAERWFFSMLFDGFGRCLRLFEVAC